MDVRAAVFAESDAFGGWRTHVYLGSSGAGRSLACALSHVVRRHGGLVGAENCTLVLLSCGPRADRLAWPPSPRLALCAACDDFFPLQQ